MTQLIGIRREDKNKWESRTPLLPAHVEVLHKQDRIDVYVQDSSIRAFSADAYRWAGATIVDDLSKCPVVFAIKELPLTVLEPRKTYVFFSHTIKGQKDNMPMLKRLMDLGCHLIDYEKIVDEDGKRLVFFGNYAGLAGMIDALWALGQRLKWEAIESPFQNIMPTHQYENLEAAKAAVQEVGERIARTGLDSSLMPLICGFAGYGNVSRGAQEIFDLLPVREIAPADLAMHEHDPHCVYKVIFKEQDMVDPVVSEDLFDLQDYYKHPSKYRAKFEDYVPYLTVLVNGIYWEERYPRLVTQRYLRELFSGPEKPKLRVIADISCDVEGSIECNLRATTPGNPIYVYDPRTGETHNGAQGFGVVILAVDNLPCELPIESSTQFSSTLLPFVPEIARANYDAPLDESNLSPTVKRAVITWQGQLAPDYQYLEEFLQEENSK
jgi:saccharopine dehydrogenase (NAD+, L-lysine-forming)